MTMKRMQGLLRQHWPRRGFTQIQANSLIQHWVRLLHKVVFVVDSNAAFMFGGEPGIIFGKAAKSHDMAETYCPPETLCYK